MYVLALRCALRVVLSRYYEVACAFAYACMCVSVGLRSRKWLTCSDGSSLRRANAINANLASVNGNGSDLLALEAQSASSAGLLASTGCLTGNVQRLKHVCQLTVQWSLNAAVPAVTET